MMWVLDGGGVLASRLICRLEGLLLKEGGAVRCLVVVGRRRSVVWVLEGRCSCYSAY